MKRIMISYDDERDEFNVDCKNDFAQNLTHDEKIAFAAVFILKAGLSSADLMESLDLVDDIYKKKREAQKEEFLKQQDALQQENLEKETNNEEQS